MAVESCDAPRQGAWRVAFADGAASTRVRTTEKVGMCRVAAAIPMSVVARGV